MKKRTLRIFGALCALAIVAIAVSACGSSNKPSSNDVAVVAGNPITKTAYAHWMYVADKGQALEEEEQGQSVPVIVPSDPPEFTSCIAQIRAQIPTYKNTPAKTLKADCTQLFTSLNSSVMPFLIEAYWYQASAYKQGIKITQKELNSAFKQAQKSTFPTATAYKEFLAETGETKQDVSFRLRVNTIFQKLIDKLSPKVTTAAEMKYYTAHASEFGTPETRSIKLIQTTSKANIQKALSALNSGSSWATVAKQYSTNAATKNSGGVISDVQQNQEEAAVNKVIFASPVNKIEGPIKGTFGYYLVEVTKITAATKSSFKKEQAEIKELITEQNQTTATNKLNKAEKKEWGSQTQCTKAFQVSECGNYVAPKTTTSTTTTAAASGSTGSASTSTATSTTASSTTTG